MWLLWFIALEQTSNRPFLIYLVLVSNWRTFHMKTSMICKKMNMSDTCRWNTFPYKWVCTKTAFDRYEKGNLEMASTRMSIGSSKFAQLFFNIFYFSCLFFQLHTCIDRHTMTKNTIYKCCLSSLSIKLLFLDFKILEGICKFACIETPWIGSWNSKLKYLLFIKLKSTDCN